MARIEYFRPPQTWEPDFLLNPGFVTNVQDLGNAALVRFSGPFDLYIEMAGRTSQSAVLTGFEVRTTDGRAIARIDELHIPIDANTTGLGSISFDQISVFGTHQSDVFGSPVPAESADFFVFVFDGFVDGRGGHDVIDLRNSFVDTESEFEAFYTASPGPGGDVVFTARDGSETVTLRSIEEIRLEDAVFSPQDYLANGGIGGTTHPTVGNDRIDLNGLQRPIDGGPGFDIAELDGARSDYSLDVSGSRVTIKGAGTITEVTNVERIAFADWTLAFDDTAKRAYRLYEAAFDRQPDAPGLGHWVRQLDQGMTLREAAELFIASDEFRLRYGDTPDDTKFVNLVYNNVLDRDPDPLGQAHWLQQLQTGETRADVLIGFSESAENRASLDSVLDDGVWFL